LPVVLAAGWLLLMMCAAQLPCMHIMGDILSVWYSSFWLSRSIKSSLVVAKHHYTLYAGRMLHACSLLAVCNNS
jgi:hypothetical protein